VIRPSLEFTPGGVRVTNATFKNSFRWRTTFDLSGFPAVRDGPTDSEGYTVIAKGPEGSPVLSEAARLDLTRRRLRALLRERFHLALKAQANPATGYVLVVDKQGH
jgi:uncharacterized protein (TIGR03435 family)